jgi:hypothetical protein
MHIRIWALAVLVLATTRVEAQNVPQAFSIQGILRDKMGGLQSAMVNVTVSFFDAQTNGNRLAGPYGPTALMASDGLFTLTVNDPNISSSLQGKSALWLQVTAGNDTFDRQLVTPEIYALMCGNADQLGGHAASYYFGMDAVIPAANGGTGINSPGAAGNVLVSNGSQWTSGSVPGASVSNIVVAGAIPFGRSIIIVQGGDTTIAHLTLPALPQAGFVVVDWTVSLATNAVGPGCDAQVNVYTSAQKPNGEPFAVYASGVMISSSSALPMAGHSVLPVHQGAGNVLYLEGIVGNCSGGGVYYWRGPQMVARFESATIDTTGLSPN